MAELRDKYSKMLRQAGQPPISADATAADGAAATVDAKAKVTAESGDAQHMKVRGWDVLAIKATR